jgi:ABC-type multidrug transport system ATPase subunit
LLLVVPHSSFRFPGLDASVTFDIVHSLRRRAQQDNISVVIALLQPTPEVYALFDEVILLREGQVLYHGARTELPGYLRNLGFEVPEEKRQTAAHVTEVELGKKQAAAPAAASKALDQADFLSEWLFLPHKGLPERGLTEHDKVPPLTTHELVAEWKASPLYKQQMSINDKPLSLDSDFAKAQYGTNSL